MKTIKYLGMLLAALSFSVFAVSCVEESENSISPAMKELVKMIDDAITSGDVTTSLSSTDRSITLCVKYQDFLTMQHDATFDANQILTRCIQTYTLDTEERASKIFGSLDKEIKSESSLRGNVITVDVTSGWAGASYEEYMLFAQSACEEYKHSNPLKEEEYSESNKYTTSLVVSDNFIVLTIKHNGSKREEKHVVTYNNGIYVSYIVTITNVKEANAKQEYESKLKAIRESNLPDKEWWLSRVTLRGNTIIEDRTDNFPGFDYDGYIEYLSDLQKQYK